MTARLSDLIAPAYRDLHRAVKADQYAEYWLQGGRGSGKSSFIALQIVLGLLRDPMASALVCRKVAATLRESVFAQMQWAISALGLEGCFTSRLVPMEIQRRDTGQRILFRGADDPGKLKSLKLPKGYFRYLWLEELPEFDGMEDVRTIKASALRGAPAACATFYSLNPPRDPGSWVNQEALVPRDDRRVHKSTYRDLPAAWLGEAFLREAEHLRAVDPRGWRHMYLGEATGNGGQVFDNLQLRAPTPEEIGALHAFYTGLDFGFAADPDALVRVGWEPRSRRLYLLEEYVALRTPVDALAAQARRVAGDGVVRCDSAEPRMIHELRARGVQAVGAKKGPGSVAHGLRWLQELPAIVIDPARCPAAAREFSTYACPADGLGGFRSEFPDRDNHTLDAVRYALEGVIGRREAQTLNRRSLGLG